MCGHSLERPSLISVPIALGIVARRFGSQPDATGCSHFLAVAARNRIKTVVNPYPLAEATGRWPTSAPGAFRVPPSSSRHNDTGTGADG